MMTKTAMQQRIECLDEMYMDAPGDPSEKEATDYANIRELIGIALALASAVETMALARQVIVHGNVVQAAPAPQVSCDPKFGLPVTIS
jgi:hypothetical protein